MAQFDEVALKAQFWNSTTVDARLEDTFPGAARREAAVVLAGLVGEDPSGDAELSDEASCRLMLAALKLSAGDLMKLALWAQAAHDDPRDLIGAAEYGRELQGLGEDARDADLAEYLAWVSGNSR